LGKESFQKRWRFTICQLLCDGIGLTVAADLERRRFLPALRLSGQFVRDAPAPFRPKPCASFRAFSGGVNKDDREENATKKKMRL